MNPLIKALIWVTMTVALALGILVLDVRRAIAKGGRVAVQGEAQAEAILARFRYDPAYLGRVVDEVPKTDWLILLDLFPRHTQLVFVRKFASLDEVQKASLVASHVPMFNRAGQLVTGLDRAAKSWLNLPFESVTPQHLDELAKHQKRSKTSSQPVKPAIKSAAPKSPGQGGGARRDPEATSGANS